MKKQLRHTRFTIQNEQLSLSMSYWYVKASRSIEPIGSVNDFIPIRPGYANT